MATALTTLLLGIAPMLSNLIGNELAGWIGGGCYVHESDMPPCMVASVNLSPLLHYMTIAGYLFFLSWPLVIVSNVLFAIVIVRLVRA